MATVRRCVIFECRLVGAALLLRSSFRGSRAFHSLQFPCLGPLCQLRLDFALLSDQVLFFYFLLFQEDSTLTRPYVTGKTVLQDSSLQRTHSWLVGPTKADITYYDPAKIQSLGVGCVVMAIALAAYFMYPD